MGYYIETVQPKNKAAAIRQELDALDITVDEAEFFLKEQMGGAIICVVDNGPFEAAAYCYSLDEFRAFNRADDPRPRTWLLVQDEAKVKELTRFNK
jgi:hypothetical protein